MKRVQGLETTFSHVSRGFLKYLTAIPIMLKWMFAMRPKQIFRWIIVSTLVLIAISSVAFSAKSSILKGSSELDKANSLFSILEEANATVVKVYRQLEAKGIAAPQDSLLQYNQALLLASEADSMIQLGKYSEASATCIEAIQKLKESLRIIYGSVTEQPSEFEANIEKTIALNSSINRFFDQLHKIENLTSIARANGFNTTELETQTKTVQSLLSEASNKMKEGELDAASENLFEAKALISNLSSNLNELATDLKVQRLSTYITATQVRLEALKARAISISNTASLTFVNQAEDSLSNAKEYLEQQLINQTLTELADSKDSELQAEKILSPTLNSTSSLTSRSPTVTAAP